MKQPKQPRGRPRMPETDTINFRIPITDKAELKKLPISKLFKEWYKALIPPNNTSTNS